MEKNPAPLDFLRFKSAAARQMAMRFKGEKAALKKRRGLWIKTCLACFLHFKGRRKAANLRVLARNARVRECVSLRVSSII